jgi:hypothetical protein
VPAIDYPGQGELRADSDENSTDSGGPVTLMPAAATNWSSSWVGCARYNGHWLGYAEATGGKRFLAEMHSTYLQRHAVLEPYMAAYHKHLLGDFWTDFTKRGRAASSAMPNSRRPDRSSQGAQTS